MAINNCIYYYYKYRLFIKSIEYNDFKILRFVYLNLFVYICLNNNNIKSYDTI